MERTQRLHRNLHLPSLIWFETHQDIAQAIGREKQPKGWRRKEKIALIRKTNPAQVEQILVRTEHAGLKPTQDRMQP